MTYLHAVVKWTWKNNPAKRLRRASHVNMSGIYDDTITNIRRGGGGGEEGGGEEEGGEEEKKTRKRMNFAPLAL
jgi:hypothetical protein